MRSHSPKTQPHTNMRLKTLPALLFILAVLFFTGVMTGEVLPYFKFEYADGFLGTKPDSVLQKVDFQWAFYIHISSSLVAIFAGLWQFWPFLHRKYPKLHRQLGKTYILAILLLAAPSGLVLGYYANAGLPAKTGFMLQSILWWVLTFLAWWEIKKQRWLAHTDMMIRSFAVTLAAMSLRTESYAMYYFFHTKPIETYVTVTWLSWVGNFLIAEMLVYIGLGKRILAQING